MIDYAEYQNLGFTKLTKEQFDGEKEMANVLIENITQCYYSDYYGHLLTNDLNSTDNFIKRRATLYEKAICVQCEFQADFGSSPMEQAQNQSINSISIGKTAINYGKNTNISYTKGDSGVCTLAYRMLYPTGLLYTGVMAR